MKIIIITLIFFTLTIPVIYGQNIEPIDLAKKIFSKENTINITKYSIGEYKGSPNGKNFQNGTTTRFNLLEQKANKAVVAMTVLDSVGKGFDTYLYFEKLEIWKMSAFRSLAMTGIIEAVKNELEMMSEEQIANTIKKSNKNQKDKNSPFSSIEEYNFLLGNAKLTLELDENIIKHFLKNKVEFERIKNLALLELSKKKSTDERGLKLVKELELDYKSILIDGISTGGYELGDGINFLIGGILDNAVGYLYVNDKKDLPEMGEGGVIMIREIGNGWYIYKTT